VNYSYDLSNMERKRYYRQLGWKKSPFIKSTSMDTPIIMRQNEYAVIRECIGGWDRVMIVTAPIGYGKTTFMNTIVKNKPPEIDYVVFFDSYEPIAEVMDRVISKLPIWKRLFTGDIDRTLFGEFLQKKLGNKKILLLFDEAQDYDNELFKWLRILNDRVDNLFMVFFGLRGLEDKITSETSFRDRKTKSITLTPFTIDDLQSIVIKRIQWVGGKGMKPFTSEGLKRLCESANYVPRRLMENGQRVIEECSAHDIISINEEIVERIIGTYAGEDVRLVRVEEVESKSEEGVEATKDALLEREPTVEPVESKSYDLMSELSPTQQEIVNLLMQNESLSITEMCTMLNKDIRSIGSLIRKLRGLNPEEITRKPNIQYPVVVRRGKETRMGRVQYVYGLSDNTRRMLAK
jgi:predicted transcriptional regulator